jgi:ankyrin repeat protein
MHAALSLPWLIRQQGVCAELYVLVFVSYRLLQDTLLHVASRGGQPGVVRLLLHAGANDSLKNEVCDFPVALPRNDLQLQRTLLR